jgi:sigma-B regulation protein RsbU (phosphoserine phosphatase)
VFYCLLNSDGQLHYVNAAHCPPMVVRTGAELVELEATGMPVGLMDGAVFAVAQWDLLPGDKVVVYSDGVTEAQNTAGEFFGKKRLRALLATHAAESCTTIHDAIQDAVAAFAEGAQQSDDITVMVIEYRG